MDKSRAGQTYAWTPHSYPVQSSVAQTIRYDVDIQDECRGKPQTFPITIRAVQNSQSAIPPGRNLIICLDGTGDKFDNDNSNVVQFVSCLKKDDPNQVTYYQSGIGTYDGHGLSSGFSAAIDMAVGSGLGTHIKDAYRFLMQNYKEGDRICLLGFSRGAYTVRCLAGMLHKCGLLPAHNLAQVPFAYNFYKNDTPEGWKMSAQFKKTFCIDVSVYFVGVWDCVASVGFIPRKLPFSKTPSNRIAYFRHAMALDERRAKFKICRWTRQDRSQELYATKNRHEHWQGSERTNLPRADSATASESEKSAANDSQRPEEDVRADTSAAPSDISEVWFTGAHADVGGGAVHNDERHMLSRIPLRWMIRQTFQCNTGILFHPSALAEVGLDVQSLWPVYQPQHRPIVGPSPSTMEKFEAGDLSPISRRSSSLLFASHDKEKATGHIHSRQLPSVPLQHPDLLPEQVEDHFDSLAPINDQLVQAKGWWILELWPVKIRIQRADSDDWEKVVRMNMGRARATQDAEPIMHWTVKQRMEETGYKTRNRVGRNAVWRVTI